MAEDERIQFVQPFYLKMMRLRFIEYGADLLPAIIEAGREATPTDVVALLNDPWRASVMGAWFALLFDDEHVTESVLQALSSSSGSLRFSTSSSGRDRFGRVTCPLVTSDLCDCRPSVPLGRLQVRRCGHSLSGRSNISLSPW